MEFKKIITLISGLWILLASLTSCGTINQHTSKSNGEELVVRTTAYSHNERDHIAYLKKNAVGTNLQYNSKVRSAAADWSEFPVGTEFQIDTEPGITYVIDDYGSALVGTKTIDLYKPSIRSMNHWGVRHVNIEIKKWGSFEESLKIMQPRARYRHVRKMVHSIQNDGKAI
jgi:3D (Asp-Asp-Asp) domain-containing protein